MPFEPKDLSELAKFRADLSAGVGATRPELAESDQEKVVETMYRRYLERSSKEALMKHASI